MRKYLLQRWKNFQGNNSTLRKVLCLLVLAVMLAAMLCIWPFELIRRDQDLHSGDTEAYSQTELLTPGTVVRQEFIAQESRLQKLSFSFSLGQNLYPDTTVTFELLSPGGKVLTQQVITMAQLQKSNYCTVDCQKWIHKGQTYSYTLTVAGPGSSELYLLCTPGQSNFAPGNTQLLQNDQVLPGQAYNSYIYGMPLNYKNVIFEWAAVCTIGLCLLSVCLKKQR